MLEVHEICERGKDVSVSPQQFVLEPHVGLVVIASSFWPLILTDVSQQVSLGVNSLGISATIAASSPPQHPSSPQPSGDWPCEAGIYKPFLAFAERLSVLELAERLERRDAA